MFTGDKVNKADVVNDLADVMSATRIIENLNSQLPIMRDELSKTRSKTKKDSLRIKINNIESDRLRMGINIQTIVEKYA